MRRALAKRLSTDLVVTPNLTSTVQLIAAEIVDQPHRGSPNSNQGSQRPGIGNPAITNLVVRRIRARAVASRTPRRAMSHAATSRSYCRIQEKSTRGLDQTNATASPAERQGHCAQLRNPVRAGIASCDEPLDPRSSLTFSSMRCACGDRSATSEFFTLARHMTPLTLILNSIFQPITVHGPRFASILTGSRCTG